MHLNVDICVIGGGVIGSSIAYFTSASNARIALLERSQVGKAGATAVSRGILRVYDPLLPLAQLSKSSLTYYSRWAEMGAYGTTPTCHSGMLYRLNQRNVEQAQRIVENLSDNDYSVYLGPLRDINVDVGDLAWSASDYVIYEPHGGFGDPAATAQQFMKGAQNRGARLLENTSVLSIEQEKNQQWRVITPEHVLTTSVVVVAAGAYISDVIHSTSCYTRSIPIVCLKQKINHGVTSSIIDEISNTYIRPLNTEQFIAGSQLYDKGHWSNLQQEINIHQINDALKRTSKVLNNSSKLEVQSGVVGFDAYTEDLLPLVGEFADQVGLYFATGFSGRGYKLAPAIGIGIAQALAEKYGFCANLPFAPIDLSSFTPNQYPSAQLKHI